MRQQQQQQHLHLRALHACRQRTAAGQAQHRTAPDSSLTITQGSSTASCDHTCSAAASRSSTYPPIHGRWPLLLLLLSLHAGRTMGCRRCMSLQRTVAAWSAADTLGSARVSERGHSPAGATAAATGPWLSCCCSSAAAATRPAPPWSLPGHIQGLDPLIRSLLLLPSRCSVFAPSAPYPLTLAHPHAHTHQTCITACCVL